MTTKLITVCMASRNGQPPMPAEILISAPFPQHGERDEVFALFARDAERIERALYVSLPRGTYDRLLAQMMARTASGIIASWSDYEASSDVFRPKVDAAVERAAIAKAKGEISHA